MYQFLEVVNPNGNFGKASSLIPHPTFWYQSHNVHIEQRSKNVKADLRDSI